MKGKRVLKLILCFSLSLMMLAVFTPIQASAAGFSTKGQVEGFAVTGTTTTSVSFSWNSYSGAAGYQVYKATTEDGKYSKIKTLKKTSWTRTGLTPGKTVYYKVRAYKEGTDKTSYSKFSQIIPGTPEKFSATDPVTGLKVSAYTYNTVTLAWDSYANATGYQVYKATSKGGTYSKLKTVTANSWKRTGLTMNKTCYYKVRAYFESGSSTSYSKFSEVVAGKPTLGTPKNVKTTSKAAKVVISFDSVADAKGYAVYRATSKSGTYTKLGTTTKTTYDNDNLTKLKQYYYKVRAYRSVNGTTKYGEYSEVVGGCTIPSSLSAPTVTVKASGSSIVVSWKAITGATGYEVTRATNDDDSYKKIADVSDLSYTDKNVKSGETYYYKVRAYYSNGTDKLYSSYNTTKHSRKTLTEYAYSYYGTTQGSSNHKTIVNTYNKNFRTKFSTSTAWCGMFVGYCAIQTGYTDIIKHNGYGYAYVPYIWDGYPKSRTTKDKYTVPSAGDIIFFDWNESNMKEANCRDHVGYVYSVSGKTVKTIEGNTTCGHASYGVWSRTFTAGEYKNVYGYCMPAYNDAMGVTYEASLKDQLEVAIAELLDKTCDTSYAGANVTAENISEDNIRSAIPEANKGDAELVEGIGDVAEDYGRVDRHISDSKCDAAKTDLGEMKYILGQLDKYARPDSLKEATKGEYFSAFVFELCKERGISACIINAVDENGKDVAWVEAELDGQLYKIDMTKSVTPKKFTPEESDTKGTK